MTSRRLSILMLAWLGLGPLPGRAQDDDGLLHYEPPSVERVYPVPPGTVLPPCSSCGEDEDGPETPSAAAARDGGAGEAGFGASATVQRRIRKGTTLEADEARDVPGSFGDPLRIIDALPGVTPIASGVPYVYMRGAPPAAQGYVYDGIPLPQLFHGAFGPAVIHPRATGAVELFAGIAPASQGRRTGGFVLLEGVEPGHRLTGEVDIRLLDVNGFIDAPLGKGDVTASGRIGYPRLSILAAESLGVIQPGTRFDYWDGQLRVRHPLSPKDRVELVWLGSFDTTELPDLPEDQETRTGATQLEFHRLELRLRHALPRGHISSAVRFGYDDSRVGETLHVRALSVGPRLWSELHLGAGHQLEVGFDAYTSSGRLDDRPRQQVSFLEQSNQQLLVSLPELAEAPARLQGGSYASLSLALGERTQAELGARLDYWSVESEIEVAVDPRLRLEHELAERLALHAAAGTGHQPAVFLLPLPGLTDIAVSRGLSRSVQTEVGARATLPLSLSLQVNAFYHRYWGLLLPELITDADLGENPPLAEADVVGAELLLRRDMREDLSGWVSYTLSFAEADSGPDLIGRFHPDFDVRHVLNAVLNARVWSGWVLGSRIQARSGRLIEQLNPRYEQRLPWYFRADGIIGYQWQGRWADMFAYVEWLNLTIAREYLDADCFFGQCVAQAAPPIALPNLGVRGTFR